MIQEKKCPLYNIFFFALDYLGNYWYVNWPLWEEQKKNNKVIFRSNRNNIILVKVILVFHLNVNSFGIMLKLNLSLN